MWQFLRRQTLYFLIGFVITFIVYLFIRFSADAVILGVAVAAGGGIGASVVLFMLERRFPDNDRPPTAT
jgi:hypothetical protein